ncbi:ABC transporter permease subunit [Rhizobium rhizogenes]|uniref:Taurine ABC transporter permease protein n=1 Tax=Rhizobium rhizogenes NBRC 13257 TaxID=1220581 RepID=A0AA87QAU9_RHIRH|nr:ABC transporter permease subunit [Rhizobium rhizogenes]GAJ93989.1 taurine ABC transporter permease protein [Rhizobium rhizogenes NBRC 13257]NTF75703.1 ABC transporter permease subunit [Rhizobium rhizogenes]NTF94731.1 ABC transporter permease subunit [Rhizobium rhizogenes]NTG01382.1 ABC transporter permease subunit [Rhizobium rhizogenes]
MTADIEKIATVATKSDAVPATKNSSSGSTLWISLATVLALLVIWAIAAAYSVVSPVFLPSPLTVAKALYALNVTGFVDSTLLEHAFASLLRIFGGLAVSLVIGIPAGLAIASSRVGKGILDPIVEFLRPLPPLAYLPLVIIWVGIGEASKITVIALAMLPPIILSTAAGVKAAPVDYVNAARSFGAGRLQVLRHVILPGAIPSILTGIRIALGAGWSTLVAAELVAASQGLGFMIQSAAQFLVTDIVISGIIVIALIAFLFEITVRLIERRLVPWSAHR